MGWARGENTHVLPSFIHKPGGHGVFEDDCVIALAKVFWLIETISAIALERDESAGGGRGRDDPENHIN